MPRTGLRLAGDSPSFSLLIAPARFRLYRLYCVYRFVPSRPLVPVLLYSKRAELPLQLEPAALELPRGGVHHTPRLVALALGA